MRTDDVALKSLLVEINAYENASSNGYILTNKCLIKIVIISEKIISFDIYVWSVPICVQFEKREPGACHPVNWSCVKKGETNNAFLTMNKGFFIQWIFKLKADYRHNY